MSRTGVQHGVSAGTADGGWTREAIAACVLTAGSALAWNPWGLNGFHAIKITTITVSTLLAFRWMLVQGRLRVPPAWRWFVAFIALAFLSALFSGTVRTGFFGYPDRHAGALLFVVMLTAYVVGASLDSPARRHVISTAVVAGSTLAALLVVQSAGVEVFADVALTGGRPTATFGSAAFAGAYLTTALPLSWYVRLQQTTARGRALATTASALILVGLVLTGARAAWIGVAVSIGILAWSERHRLGNQAMPAAFVAGVIAVMFAASATVRARFSSLFSPSEGTAGGRLALWEGVVPTVARRPLLGWGPDGTRRGFPQELPSDFERRFGVDTIPDRAHNAVFDLIIWVGIPATIVALVGVVVVCRAVLRATDASDERTALIAAVAAFATHLMFNFTTFELDVVVALLAGMLVAGVATPLRLSVAAATTGGWAVSGLIVVAGISGAMLIAADTAADRAVTAENAGDLESARSRWRTAVDLSFGDAQLLEGWARFEMRAGSFPDAIVAADRAVDAHSDVFTRELAAQVRLQQTLVTGPSDPAELADIQQRYESLVDHWDNHGSAHVGLGIAYALRGDNDRASDAFERAIEIRPTDVAALENLARIRLTTGDVIDARRLTVQALEVDPENESLAELLVAIDNRDAS